VAVVEGAQGAVEAFGAQDGQGGGGKGETAAIGGSEAQPASDHDGELVAVAEYDDVAVVGAFDGAAGDPFDETIGTVSSDHLLNQLTDSTREWLVARTSERSLDPDETLFLEGQDSRSLFVIADGLLRIERVAITGQRQLLTLASRSDTVGEVAMLTGGDRSASAVALQKTRLSVVSAADAQHALNSYPDFGIAVARKLADRLTALTDQLLEVTSGTALSRTASRILQLVPENLTEGIVDIETRVSQVELAAWSGLSREGTVKALRDLRDSEILETSRRHLRVLDVARLRDVAIGG
jgi:CRP/FNR family transcriptional regulator, cyclic AMP receptor protein